MEAKAPQNVIFFLICVFFSPLMAASQMDIPPGDFPFVNPTTPGTAPIVNPPYPPTTTIPGPPTTTSPKTSGGGVWCIASSSASETALQVALDYACGYGGADCSAIQPSGACYDPSTIRDHACYAFNDYYQKNPAPTSCVFGGTAQLSYTDPSSRNCRFASSSGISTSAPTTNPPSTTNPPPTLPASAPVTNPPPMTNPSPTLPMPPPSTTTPTNPYPPVGNGYGSDPSQATGGYDYGSEPTGTPSSAQTLPINLLLFMTMNCLILR